jgi:hypothetical protein
MAKTVAQLLAEIDALLPTNATQEITALDVRTVLDDVVTSNANLAANTVVPGAYANANITVDAQGLITAAANGTAGSSGTVTNVATGTGLTGGPITSTGTISLSNTSVAAGHYTNTEIIVDAQGRLTFAANGASGGGGNVSTAVGPPPATANQISTWTDATHIQGITTIPIGNIAGGLGGGASSSTFLRGDNTWQVPPGTGNVSAVGSPASPQIAQWTGSNTIQGIPVAASPTTQFLRGDNTWVVPPAGGNVNSVPTPASGQIAIWTGATTIEGLPNLPVTNLNNGSGASASTFWRGDGIWATPAGGGNVSAVPTPASGQIASWTSATTIQGLPNLPVTNLNNGTGASNLTFWRGDGTWQPAAGLTGAPATGQIAVWANSTQVQGIANASSPTTMFLRGDNTWQFIPSAAVTQRSVTASTATIGAGDQIINCNVLSPAGTFCTMPQASTRSGLAVSFIDVGGQALAHPLTIAAFAGDTFKSSSGSTTSIILSLNYQRLTFTPFNDGVNVGWYVQ